MGKNKKQGIVISRRELLAGLTGLGVLSAGVGYLATRSPDRQKKLERLFRDPRLDPVREPIVSVTYSPRIESALAYMQDELAIANKPARKIYLETQIDSYKIKVQDLERIAKGEKIQKGELFAFVVKTNHPEDKKDIRARIFVTERFYESQKIRTDEDRVSVLYHECLHPYISRNGLSFRRDAGQELIRKLGTTEIPKEISYDFELSTALSEVQVYNEQLTKNFQGVFKVSSEANAAIIIAYTAYYQTLKKYAKRDDVKGWFAQAMLKTAVVKPTVKIKK